MSTMGSDPERFVMPNVRLIADKRAWRVDPAQEAELLALPPMFRHLAYHLICRSVYAQTVGEPPDPPSLEFREAGVTTIPAVIPRNLALKLSAFATELLAAAKDSIKEKSEYQADGANLTVPIPAEFRSVFLDLLPTIFAPAVARPIEHTLASHFRIDHWALYRTRPVPVAQGSFQWHRDLAPMGQIHIMLYLTDSGPEGGGTEFLSLADTRRMAEAGYAFPNVGERISELSDLIGAEAEAIRPIRPRPNAGDAILFAATRVLHRGILPKRGFRDVLLLVLHPSTQPWRHELEDFGSSHIFVSGDREAYISNPFRRFNPTLPEGYTKAPTEAPPSWAAYGYLTPNG